MLEDDEIHIIKFLPVGYTRHKCCCGNVRSPPWYMNPGTSLWREKPLQANPFSLVFRVQKFSAVSGTWCVSWRRTWHHQQWRRRTWQSWPWLIAGVWRWHCLQGHEGSFGTEVAGHRQRDCGYIDEFDYCYILIISGQLHCLHMFWCLTEYVNLPCTMGLVCILYPSIWFIQ